jgi:hypothetical protein
MWLPVISGVIDRRILVNYRVDPAVLAEILPPPFRPQLVGRYGLAGICLIRLREVRPRGLPRWIGISSENAAHRVAVEWDDGGKLHTGVYVLRRDTDSRLNAFAGGRIFPGVHHRANFRVDETTSRFAVSLHSRDDQTSLSVVAELADFWPRGSIFGSLQGASAFFQAGSLGYSPKAGGRRFEGLELRCPSWRVEPLSIERANSSFFDDLTIFPHGSVELDCGLLMRGIEHEWRCRDEICCQTTAHAAADSSHRAFAATTSA